MTVRIPPWLDWEVWRIVSSPFFSETMDDVLNRWTLEDVHDAHAVLDLREELERKAARKARR